MVNHQESYLLVSISQMKQFLDLHLDFFFIWRAITMVMELRSLFLTTFLWNHLFNYLHTVTLGGPPRRLCFSLYQGVLDFSPSCILHGRGIQVSLHMPGLFQQWAETLRLPTIHPRKGTREWKRSEKGKSVKERAFCSPGTVLSVACLHPAALVSSTQALIKMGC